MRRSWLVIGLCAAAACGSEPSGVLTITLNPLPEFTTELTIAVSGTVTRAPVSETPIVVSIAGGQITVSDTIPGSFSLAVAIAENAETQLVVTATDGTGSVSEAVIVAIVHDDAGPALATSVPTNEGINVPLNTAIEIRFGEPLVQGTDALFALTQNSRTVLGSVTLSEDNTLITIEPDQLLEPFSIYEVVMQGFTDAAGNPVADGRNFCFVTTSEGLQTTVTTDSSNSFFTNSTDATQLQAPNIIGATLARGGSTLYGIFAFDERRSLLGDADKVSIFLDIDIDNDPATGFTTFKDFQLDSIPNAADFDTGLGAEILVSLDAHVIANRAFVGVTTADDPAPVWQEIDVFFPGICGPFFGFHTTTILGDSIQDQGNFSYAYSAFAIENPTGNQSAIFMDPVPVSGHFDAELTDPGTPALLRLVPPKPETHYQRVEGAYWRIKRLLRSR